MIVAASVRPAAATLGVLPAASAHSSLRTRPAKTPATAPGASAKYAVFNAGRVYEEGGFASFLTDPFGLGSISATRYCSSEVLRREDNIEAAMTKTEASNETKANMAMAASMIFYLSSATYAYPYGTADEASLANALNTLAGRFAYEWKCAGKEDGFYWMRRQQQASIIPYTPGENLHRADVPPRYC